MLDTWMHSELSALATIEGYHSSYLRVSMDVEGCLGALFFQLVNRLNLSPGEEVSYVDNDSQDKVQHDCKRGISSK